MMRLVFNEEESIKCVHTALAVKMEPLREKYRGGPKKFMEKYGARCNRDLAVIISMNDADIDSYVDDLFDQGFVYKEDFMHVDAFADMISYHMFKKHSGINEEKVDLGVDWLKGFIRDNGIMVSYISE